MVDWISLFVPFAYVGILVSSLATFSSLYRKRKASQSYHLAPYFSAHTPRDIYLTLLHTESPKPPDSLLRSSLLLRACEDIRRILTVRARKPALQTLLQRGSVGDDLWQRLLRAEKELEEEVRDVVSEANALANGWGQVIFQSANEMVNREILNEKLAKIRETEGREKEKWERFKVERRANALKDLGADASDADDEKPSGKATVLGKADVQSEVPATTATSVAGSDEDAVLVEKENAAPSPAGTPSTPSKKKKKGKK